MKEIFFITGNKDKFARAIEVIPSLVQLDIDLPEIQNNDPHEVIKAKMIEAFKHHSGPLVVEDTSLFLDSIPGLPGPLIKWFTKSLGNEGLARLAIKMENQKAVAKVIVGFASDANNIHYFEADLDGKIVLPRGENGFGWDPIFEVEKFSKTLAEITESEKSEISMRKVAFEKLSEFLATSSS